MCDQNASQQKYIQEKVRWMNEGEPTKNDLLQKLELQKSSFLSEGFVEAKTRIDRIDRSINLLKKNQKDLIKAMADDFGHRAHQK